MLGFLLALGGGGEGGSGYVACKLLGKVNDQSHHEAVVSEMIGRRVRITSKPCPEQETQDKIALHPIDSPRLLWGPLSSTRKGWPRKGRREKRSRGRKMACAKWLYSWKLTVHSLRMFLSAQL